MRCNCKPEDRRLMGSTVDGYKIYKCRVCGRKYLVRRPLARGRLGVYQVEMIALLIAWALAGAYLATLVMTLGR